MAYRDTRKGQLAKITDIRVYFKWGSFLTMAIAHRLLVLESCTLNLVSCALYLVLCTLCLALTSLPDNRRLQFPDLYHYFSDTLYIGLLQPSGNRVVRTRQVILLQECVHRPGILFLCTCCK